LTDSEISPFKVTKGACNDSCQVAVFKILAKHPELINDKAGKANSEPAEVDAKCLFEKPKNVSVSCARRISLWNHGKRESIVIDDFIPTEGETDIKPLFSCFE